MRTRSRKERPWRDTPSNMAPWRYANRTSVDERPLILAPAGTTTSTIDIDSPSNCVFESDIGLFRPAAPTNCSIASALPSSTRMSPGRTCSRRAEPGSLTLLRTNPVMTTSFSSATPKASRNGAPTILLSLGTSASAIYPVKSESALEALSLRRADGSKRQPSSATNVIPAIATTIPTGAKSNITKGSPSDCSRNVATTILGGVPISVTIPPRIVANDSGINVAPGPRSARRAASISTGINSERAATLFIKADNTPPTPAIRAMWLATRFTRETDTRAIASTTPELNSPRLTISTRAIMMVAGWPNPANA